MLPDDVGSGSSSRVPTDTEYAHLLTFRTQLRRFNTWSEEQAQTFGLSHVQHQLLLAIRGHPGALGPTISEAADYLLLKPSSMTELVDRVEAGGHLRRQKGGSDARLVRLALTPQGSRELAQLTTLVLAELCRIAPALRQVLTDAEHATSITTHESETVDRIQAKGSAR